MKKYAKWTGYSLMVLTILTVIYKHSSKGHPTPFTKTRQLINRLIEQAKDSKNNINHFIKSINEINTSRIQNHLNHFNQNINPQLNKLQRNLNQLKNNFKH